MAQGTDLYLILRGYVYKNNSPYIDVHTFLVFLEDYARHLLSKQPEWEKWTSETEAKFWAELSPLVENGRCVLLTETRDGDIYLPFYYMEKLRDLYREMDKRADVPFPDDDFLKARFPEGQVRDMNLEADMGVFFVPADNREKSKSAVHGHPEQAAAPGGSPEYLDAQKEFPSIIPECIVRINFPTGFGSALVPAYMIPRQLAEAALLKIRGYLHSHGNKEYILHKLNPHLSGREKYLRDILDQLLARPLECFRNLESSGDFASLFWTCFCSQVKNDIKKKTEGTNEIVGEDIAAMQSVCILDTCNVFYKAGAAKRKDVEFALRNLDQHLERSPFYYTLGDIIKFTNDKEVPLLNIYSSQELEEHIRRRTTESKNNDLPEWLILQGKGSERWYIKKNKYLPLCTRMLVGTRPYIKKEITGRWVKLIKSFQSEPAMEKDEAFDLLLAAYTENFTPPLIALLEDPKLLLVYSEMERSKAPIQAANQIIKDGKLLPMSFLYALRRKEMLFDAKMLLPFWYSVPFIVSIAAFFSGFGKKKKIRARRSEETAPGTKSPGTSGTDTRAIQSTARALEAALVPEGLSLDEHLVDLEARWSRLVDGDHRQDMVADVKALLRDHLRSAVKIYKTKKLSQQSLEEIADTLIYRTPALQRLGGKQILRPYMQLYMVKLLLDMKG
jgi:hypothetical protein